MVYLRFSSVPLHPLKPIKVKNAIFLIKFLCRTKLSTHFLFIMI